MNNNLDKFLVLGALHETFRCDFPSYNSRKFIHPYSLDPLNIKYVCARLYAQTHKIGQFVMTAFAFLKKFFFFDETAMILTCTRVVFDRHLPGNRRQLSTWWIFKSSKPVKSAALITLSRKRASERERRWEEDGPKQRISSSLSLSSSTVRIININNGQTAQRRSAINNT